MLGKVVVLGKLVDSVVVEPSAAELFIVDGATVGEPAGPQAHAASAKRQAAAAGKNRWTFKQPTIANHLDTGLVPSDGASMSMRSESEDGREDQSWKHLDFRAASSSEARRGHSI